MKKKDVSKLMKAKVPKFLLIGILGIFVLLFILFFIFFNYAPLFVLESSGYAINNKKISSNLQATNIEDNEKNIKLMKVTENETIYQRLNSFFIEGDGNKEVNLNYPFYLDEKSSILNLSKDMSLITVDYEEVSGYPNFTISDGKMYNQGNAIRADTNEYLFLKNSDKIYCTLKEIKIKTVLNEYTIPVNSIINFNEEFITYYKFTEKDEIKYEIIQDIDMKSKVLMNDVEDNYEEFLTKIKVLQKEQKAELLPEQQMEENNTTIENKIEEEKIEENNNEDNKDKDVSLIDNRKKVTESTSTNTKKSTNTKTNTGDPQYVQPSVECTGITAEVYTATISLNIYDPSGTITKPVEFTFYDETGKVFNRISAVSGGLLKTAGLKPSSTFEVEGTYTYLKENGDKAVRTFYNGTIQTKSLEELEPIYLSLENGEIFSDKISLTNVKINNDLSSEVLYGLAKMTLKTGNNSYNVKNSKLRELLSGQETQIETDTNLKSNTMWSYHFVATDRFGNELKVENGSGETRTAKKAPYLTVTANTKDLTETKLKISKVNPDNVQISNFKYIIYDNQGNSIKEEEFNQVPGEISVKNLDPNRYYIIRIYGSYDLNDNKGMNNNVLIGETKFTTAPISSLGLMYYNIKYDEIKSESCKIKIKIDEKKTDERLRGLLDYVKIKILDENDNEVLSKILDENELITLSECEEFEYIANNLNSKTEYKIAIENNAKLGNTVESVKVNIDYNTFKTRKKSAIVDIKNLFVTGEMIDFDVKIEDPDNAVLNETVRMEFRDSKGNLLDFEEIEVNKEFSRKIFNQLNANQTYLITFNAPEYNETDSDSTFVSYYLLKEIEAYTEEGISGTIQLTQLNKKETSKNLVDMSSEVKWYVYPNFNTSAYYGKTYDEVNKILNIGGNKDSRRCVYDLQEYAGKKVTISFKAKAINYNFGIGKFYIQNAKTDKNREQLLDINDKEWKNFSRTLVIDESGFLGFYVTGGDGLQIKELQVELGNTQTPYQEYQYSLDLDLLINLQDRRNEITENDYYIKTYKNDELIQTDRYEELDENNQVVDAIKKYTLEENQHYVFDLVIKIRDREYILDTQEVDTPRGKEIRGIYSLDDYKLIQPNGNYIVFCDLDLSPSSLRFGYTSDSKRIMFNGTLDFNGHTVTRAITASYNYGMFGQIGSNGVVKNLVVDVKNNNSVEMREFYGIFYVNYGLVENIQVKLTESTEKRNLYTELIGYSNRGTIDKFVVHTEVPYYTNNRSSCGLWYNYGIVKNGYLYGEPMRIIGDAPEEFSYERKIGGLVCVSTGAATIQNVYSLINIEILDQSDNGKECTANVVCDNAAFIKNIYSVGVGNTIQQQGGPSVYKNTSKVEECYYFADRVFNNNFNKKTTKLALIDSQFQNIMLNSEGKFNVTDTVQAGFYPTVYMSSCMPRQEYIMLPEIDDKDLPDILSCKVIEQGADTVKVEFSVNNPSGEIIQEINIQNIDTTINAQEYADGKSKVIATLSNPTKYVSTYSILSIVTQGAFNKPFTREYKQNERIINVDLYRPINSIADWKLIPKHLDENYMLLTDLDFKNEANSISITSAYLGKIEGKMHTISNIRSNRGLFYQLKGEIHNLFISNCTNTETDRTYIGLIEELPGGVVDNVHITDIELEPKKSRIGGTFLAGGIVGYASAGATIVNSSVTNPNINVAQKISTVRLAGIVGYAVSTKIENCFVQNANISTKYEIASDGVGGIVGRGNPAYITNCYATGEIFSDGDRNGGIIGYAATSGNLDNCYSLVNVKSSGNYNGGIIGYSLTPNACLSLGNVYTQEETESIGRISGYAITRKINYAYDRQLINGYIVSDDLDANLLTFTDIFDKNVYLNTLRWDDNYNYAGLENFVLPKLYNISKTELLPNQQDNTIIQEDQIRINNVDIQLKTAEYADIRVEVLNPKELDINEIEIEDMNTNISKIITDSGITYIDLRATPKKYYDSYKFSKLYYQSDEGTKNISINEKLDTKFYKQIHNINEWQNICKGDDVNTYQNYMLMNDLDFTGIQNVNYNLTMARLETQGENPEDAKVIKGITLKNVTQQSGIIQKISVNCQNIKFEDIKIYTGNNTGSNVGIIRRAEGKMKDIKFSRITIQGGTEEKTINCKMNYIGCVSTTIADTRNIELEDIDVSGTGYVGGYAGNTTNLGRNIKANNIKVVSTGSYAGGIVGYNSAGSEHIYYDIYIKNSQVYGNSYTGGIAGVSPNLFDAEVYGETPTIDENGNKVYTMIVKGGTYTGGLVGSMSDSLNTSYLNKIENVEISGGNSVGGIAGYSTDYGGSVRVVKNCSIKGTDKVGGAIGDCRGMCSNQFSIDNTITGVTSNTSGTGAKLTGNASQIGGMAGYLYVNNSTSNYWITDNVTVKGSSEIGGLVGFSKCGRISHSYSNAIVEATTKNAGGIIGYLDNTGMTAATATSSINRVLVLRSKINAPYNAGGIYGKVEQDFYMPETYFTNAYVDAEIRTLNEYSNTASTIIGEPRTRNDQIKNVYIYSGSKINDNNVSTTNDNIKQEQLWDLTKIKTASTYSTILNSTWLTNKVNSGYYPIVNSQTAYQRGIALPTEQTTSATTNSTQPNNAPLSLGRRMLSRIDFAIDSNSILQELPEYTYYPISETEFNIDFKKTDDTADLKLTINGEQKYKGKIEKRTYTFKYDYNSPIGISIEKGTVAKVASILPEQLRRNITIVGNEKIYLKNTTLMINGQEYGSEFVNVYRTKALKKDGSVLNLETKQIEVVETFDKVELTDTKPLEHFDYDNNSISTFGTYSIVNDNLKTQLYFVKNNKLSIIDDSVSFKIGNAIIDSYNGKDYQTLLGTDGKMYDYKQQINYPKNFYNSEIKEISINTEEDKKDILVMYNNGRVLCFDYTTGTEEFSEGENSDIGLLDYLKENLLNIDNVISELQDQYNDILEVQTKLENTSIEEFLQSTANTEATNEQEENNSGISINITPNSNKYTTVYNANTKEYEIYSEDKLLNSTEEKAVSETEIINSTELLSKYYLNPRTEKTQTEENNGTLYFGISIGAIIITLIILNRFSGRKRKAKTKRTKVK